MDPLDIWPVFGLRVRTPRLTLRPVDQDLAFALADLAARGVHDPASMPFLFPWTDAPADQLRQNSVRHYWERWSQFRPERWTLPLAVFDGDELVGLQDAVTDQFALTREFETGSWLGAAFQGRGIGKEMRAAILHLLFAGLGATAATTGAYLDNHASLGVTRSLGYRENGEKTVVRRGEPATVRLFRLTRQDWAANRRADIVLEGLTGACLAQFGVTTLEP